jgi:hypothetical protein
VSIRTRQGPRPATTPTNPHTQLDQQPIGSTVRDRLAAIAFALPGVQEQESAISVPGARALWLTEGADGPPEAFMVGSEFAHFHPVNSDQSLHMMLPPEIAEEAIAAGWAELHPVARRGLLPPTAVMVYAPRDDLEHDIVADLIRVSHMFARGSWGAQRSL